MRTCGSRKTGKLIYKFTGHWGEISAVRIRGDTVVSASTDMTVRVWSIRAKEEVLLLDEYGYEVRAAFLGFPGLQHTLLGPRCLSPF